MKMFTCFYFYIGLLIKSTRFISIRINIKTIRNQLHRRDRILKEIRNEFIFPYIIDLKKYRGKITTNRLILNVWVFTFKLVKSECP